MAGGKSTAVNYTAMVSLRVVPRWVAIGNIRQPSDHRSGIPYWRIFHVPEQ